MVPIHDTDLAEERWSQAEWNHYELWEKIEMRVRRKRRIWVVSTVVCFLLLSSVPIIHENRPRWAALRAARHLARELQRVKRDASLVDRAFRIRFRPGGQLLFDVEQLTRCGASGPGVLIRSGSVQEGASLPLVLLDGPSLSNSFCFDPLNGLSEPSVSFGIAPSDDAKAGRDDRAVVLIANGTSAEISYD